MNNEMEISISPNDINVGDIVVNTEAESLANKLGSSVVKFEVVEIVTQSIKFDEYSVRINPIFTIRYVNSNGFITVLENQTMSKFRKLSP